MEEFKSNSHKSKEQPEKRVVEPVVANARKKKRTGLRKLTDIFIPEDVENVKSYILLDVFIPAIKKAINDIITNGVHMWLYGETDRTKKSSTASKVSYRSYYDREEPSPSRSSLRFTDVNIVVDSRAEAEAILTGMEQIIETYGVASVADMCDLASVESNHTDYKYGWSSVKNAKIRRISDGWEIDMPKRMPID